MGTEPNFSLNDFRKWMSKQKFESSKRSRCRGTIAESKLSMKRLVTKMDVDQGDLQEMAKDFKRRGGTILECDSDNILLIEVKSGTFRIPKFFVTILNSYGGES
jgi:hypothetical protein